MDKESITDHVVDYVHGIFGDPLKIDVASKFYKAMGVQDSEVAGYVTIEIIKGLSLIKEMREGFKKRKEREAAEPKKPLNSVQIYFRFQDDREKDDRISKHTVASKLCRENFCTLLGNPITKDSIDAAITRVNRAYSSMKEKDYTDFIATNLLKTYPLIKGLVFN